MRKSRGAGRGLWILPVLFSLFHGGGESLLRCRHDRVLRTDCCCPTPGAPVPVSGGACCDRVDLAPLAAGTGSAPALAAPLLAPAPPRLSCEPAGRPAGEPLLVLVHAPPPLQRSGALRI